MLALEKMSWEASSRPKIKRKPKRPWEAEADESRELELDGRSGHLRS